MFAFIGAGILYLPWVPTLLYQAANTAAPWDNVPRFGAPILISRDVLGGDRITMLLMIAGADRRWPRCSPVPAGARASG